MSHIFSFQSVGAGCTMMLGTECVNEFNLTIHASSSESLKRGLETVLGIKDGFEFRELTGGTTNRVVHCKYSGGSCVIRWDYGENKEREFSQNLITNSTSGGSRFPKQYGLKINWNVDIFLWHFTLSRIFGHGSELLVDRAEERHALQVLEHDGGTLCDTFNIKRQV